MQDPVSKVERYISFSQGPFFGGQRTFCDSQRNRLAIDQWPSPAQRNATIKSKDVGGWMNMNGIVASVSLFFAYGSIIVGTTGWFGNTHLLMR